MKKLIKIITIIMTFFITSKTCLALSINKGEKIEGFKVYIKTSLNTRYIDIYKMIKMGTNELVYNITPNDISFTETFNEYDYDGGMNDLELKTKDQIARITYYGYGYPSRTDIKWYAITQYLIWEELLKDNGEIYFVDENNNKIDIYEEERKEILSDVEHFTDLPSFFSDRKISHSFKLNEELVLEDHYNSLEDYEIYTYTPELSFQIENNILKIKSNRPTSGSIYVSKKLLELNEYMKIYRGRTSQYINRGNIGKYLGSIIIRVENPKMVIKDISKKKFSLEGTKYNLYATDGRVFYKAITLDKDGISEIKDIWPGTYYLEETEVSYGYELNKEKIYFEVKKDDITVEVTNNLIKKKVLIEKHLIKENNDEILDIGSTIKIYNEDNTLLEELITNELGRASTNIPYGTYKIVSNNKSKNNEEILLTIDSNYNEENTIIITSPEIKENIPEEKDESEEEKTSEEQVINNTGNIIIHKIDALTKMPLSGIKYGLYNEFKELIKEEVTDNNGKIIFKDLSTGKYYLKEILLDSNKVLNNEYTEIEVKKGIDTTLTSAARSEIVVPDTNVAKSNIDLFIMIILITMGLSLKFEKIK